MAITNPHTATPHGWGPAQIIESNFSKPWAIVYLAVVSAAILVCCLAIMTSTVRLCFSMARDNRLPDSTALARVHHNLHTPIMSCVVVAVVAAIPLFKYAGAGTIAIAATAMIYLAYFLGNVAILGARLKGWPKATSPFALGRWGMLVNVLALVYGAAMLINFAWPRAVSNPTPHQTNGLLSLGVGFLDKVPILYPVLGLVLVIGVIYYFAFETRKSLPVMAPAETGAFVISPESMPPDEVSD